MNKFSQLEFNHLNHRVDEKNPENLQSEPR